MKKGIKISVIGLIICFLASGIAVAEEPQFKLDIANTKLQPGVSTRLLLTIKNAKEAEKTAIKGLDNFEVLSQGSTTQTKIVNFKTTHLKKYNYQIMPQQTGTITLQGIVEYQGRKYKTNRLTVEIEEKKRKDKTERGSLFIETKLNKDEIYFGEQVVLEYNLFSRYNVQDYGFKQNPNFNNFISKKIKQDQLQAGYVRIDGQKYVKYEVAKVILTPTKTGQLKIPSFNFQVNISNGDFFNAVQSKYLQTKSQQLKVLSLPEEGQPDDFSGLVGQLELEGELAKNKVSYGESISWQVTASGTCNLDNLNQLVTDNSEQFEIYETEKNSQEQLKKGKFYSEKSFEIIMVPQRGGTLKPPKIKIPYFNSQTESHEYVTLEGQEIEVTGGAKENKSKEQQVAGDTNVNNTEQQALETVEISQINVQGDKFDNYYILKLKKNYIKWSLIILIGLILLLVIRLAVKKYWNQNDELEKIHQQIQESDSDNQLYDSLNQLIKTKYGVSLKADGRQKIKENISDSEVSQKVILVIDYIENKRYGAGELELDLKDKIIEIYHHLN